MKLSLIFFACLLLVSSYLVGYSRGYSAAVKDAGVQIVRVGDACVVDALLEISRKLDKEKPE